MSEELLQPDELPPLLGEPEREETPEIHHAMLAEERDEPAEGLEPAPWWVWTASVLVLFAMGFYLGRYGGSFSAEAHELYQRTGVARAEAAPPTPQGDFIYAAICAPCHQASGLGVSGQYPPLAGSEWVLGNAEIPVRVVLNGLRGAVVIKGQTYRNEMPGFGAQLSDGEIAAVLTYVRSSWGNQAAAVSEEVVTQARADTAGQGPWTAEKLKALEVR